MYERFTDRARKVMVLANEEAQRLRHEYIGTEHILLGLVGEGTGVAANVLKNLGVDLHRVREEAEKLVAGARDAARDRLPSTPRAKKVIEYAMEEARNLNHNYVGTEHLLLGLVREQEGVAAQVLMNCGLTAQRVRTEVLNILGHAPLPGDRLGGTWDDDNAPGPALQTDRKLTVLITLAAVAAVFSLVAAVLAMIAVVGAWLK